ncbi:MAG: phosphoglycolate phosphatase [Paraperlucidibaca sp.]
MDELKRWFGGLPQLIMMDLDGTLVDSAADIAIALNRALDDLALPPVSAELVRHGIGRGAARLMDVALQHVRPQLDNTAQRHVESEQLLAAFMHRYEDSVCEVSTVYAGVREFLEAAKAQGIALACITNKPLKPANALLDELELSSYFSVVLGGDSLTHKKPHPEPLQHTLRHFSVSAEHALMVGDSRNDVEAAKAAGVRVLALPYGYNHGEAIEACEPDRVVATLADML